MSRAGSPARHRRALLLALLVAGFLLRLWTAHASWAWFDREFPGTWERSRIVLSQDGSQYVQQADPDTWQRPFRGRWQERPYYRPPLASHFFVGVCRATGFDRLVISSLQALLAVVGYFCVFRLAAPVLGFPLALLALVWSLVHPVLVMLDVSFEDSPLAVALLAGALVAFPSRDGRSAAAAATGRLLLSGALLGLAVLARPNLVLAGVALAALASHAPGTRKRLAAPIAFVLPWAFLAGLATAHNLRSSGRFAFVVDTSGENLYWGNAAPSSARVLLQGFWDIPEIDVGSPGWLLIRELTSRHRERAIDRAFRAETLAVARERPSAIAAGLLRKAARHFASYEIPRNESFEAMRAAAPVFRWPYLSYPLTAALAALGLASLPARHRRAAAVIAIPALAVLATEVAYFNASRYRALGLPFLIPLAALGLRRCREELRARRVLRVLLGAAVLVVVARAGAALVSPLERRQHRSAHAFKAAMLLAEADSSGRLRVRDERRFLERLDAALAEEPCNPEAFVARVKYLAGRGRLEEARRAREASCARCTSEPLVGASCASLSWLVDPAQRPIRLP